MRNLDIGELAETGVDAVNHGIARDDLLDDFTRGAQCADAPMAKLLTMLAANRHGGNLLQRERLTIQLHLRSLVEKNSLGRELDKVGLKKKRPGRNTTWPFGRNGPQ